MLVKVPVVVCHNEGRSQKHFPRGAEINIATTKKSTKKKKKKTLLHTHIMSIT